MAHRARILKPGRKQLLFLLAAVVGLYVLLPQLGVFRHSLSDLAGARWPDLLLASTLIAATYFLAALTYWLLAVAPLKYRRTVLMQLASMFANRLLPASIGSIGVTFAYLRKSKHSNTEAASTIAANDLIGLIGHFGLLGVLIVVWHAQVSPSLSAATASHVSWAYRIAIIAIFAVLILARRWRQRLLHGVVQIGMQLLAYRHRLPNLGGALASSVCLTLCNVTSLYFCLTALGVHLSYVQVLIAFTVGVTVGTVTPTPGGLGGVEAGTVAGLVAYRVSGADALAAVLIYRLISYWLALAVGAAAFVTAERRNYF